MPNEVCLAHNTPLLFHPDHRMADGGSPLYAWNVLAECLELFKEIRYRPVDPITVNYTEMERLVQKIETPRFERFSRKSRSQNRRLYPGPG